jgi:tRNA nucleotidyltransferase (CCA-adding enzyme)
LFKSKKEISDIEIVQKTLKDKWVLFYSDINLLIVQDHDLISKLFPGWIFDSDFAQYLIDIQNECFSWWQKTKQDIIRILIDPHQWVQDLLNRKIKCVWDPDRRFNEDSLRIIRALRFVSVLNQKLKDHKWIKPKITLFDIDTDTWSSIKTLYGLVQNISKERIHDELLKVFSVWDPFAFVSLLDEVKLLEYIFPAVYATKNIDQPIRYHPFDVYVHTLLSLYNIQKINKNYLVRLSVLYHDVWKVWQYSAYAKTLSRDEIREILAWPLNHRVSWPEIAKIDFAKLTFSKSDIKDICRYILNHHVPGEILNANEENRVKKMRKLYSEVWFEMVNNLLDITIADRLWQYNPMQNSSDITDVEELRKILNFLKKNEWQFTQKDLAVNWKIIMNHFKLQPWPQIWELINFAMNRVMVDIKNRNSEKEILWYLKWIINK